MSRREPRSWPLLLVGVLFYVAHYFGAPGWALWLASAVVLAVAWAAEFAVIASNNVLACVEKLGDKLDALHPPYDPYDYRDDS